MHNTEPKLTRIVVHPDPSLLDVAFRRPTPLAVDPNTPTFHSSTPSKLPDYKTTPTESYDMLDGYVKPKSKKFYMLIGGIIFFGSLLIGLIPLLTENKAILMESNPSLSNDIILAIVIAMVSVGILLIASGVLLLAYKINKSSEEDAMVENFNIIATNVEDLIRDEVNKNVEPRMRNGDSMEEKIQLLLTSNIAVAEKINYFYNEMDKHQKQLDQLRIDLAKSRQIARTSSVSDRYLAKIQHIEEDMNVMKISLATLENFHTDLTVSVHNLQKEAIWVKDTMEEITPIFNSLVSNPRLSQISCDSPTV